MSQFKGKVVLIVNTATRCGLAPQFDGLEALHQKYASRGLVVLGFPSDDFAHQEPVSDEDMATVCKLNHGVSFFLSRKIQVTGKSLDPLFDYLTRELPGFPGRKVKWNFTKFLVDHRGRPVKRFAPTDSPEKMEASIQELLARAGKDGIGQGTGN